MENYRSTNNEADIWHLDSELGDEGTEDAETMCARQPWRSFWPPKCQKVREEWLHSEFPEVLSWRFDRKLPFDRPWRIWARSTRALEEPAAGYPSRQLLERLGSKKCKIAALALTLCICCY
jgi:hypothetical protein